MSNTVLNPTPAAGPAATGAAIPAAVLGALAERFRPGGVFVLMLRNDGSVAYHDAGAGAFFLRYVLPLVHQNEPPGASLTRSASHARPREVAAGPAAWHPQPGVVLAGLPYVERRQQLGVLVLAAKAPTFSLGE